MATTNDAFGRIPRAYRPSFSYQYVSPAPSRQLSQAASMGFAEHIDEAWPSQQGLPSPDTELPTSLESHRRARAALFAADSRREASPSHRRRTDLTQTQNDLGYSAPTVADFHLTASVASNDISQPTPKFQRYKLPQLRRDNSTPSRPSKIPTPTHGKKYEAEGLRNFTTPILPSQKTKKENILPQTLRLLGPISPTRQQIAIPRSRTMGMLSTLTSTFSRSNLNISNPRNVSAPATRTSEPTISICSALSPPLPTFTTDLRQIHTAQPYSYWCGRYQALLDRHSTEHFNQTLSDEALLSRYIATALHTGQSPTSSIASSLSTITNVSTKARKRNSRDSKNQSKASIAPLSYDLRGQHEHKVVGDIVLIMENEAAARQRKILMHLDMLCVTTDAKRSLWEWQVGFARVMRNEDFLPLGGTMLEYEKSGWASRLGQAIGGGLPKSSTMTNLGSRSRLAMLDKRKPSAMELKEHGAGYDDLLGEVY